MNKNQKEAPVTKEIFKAKIKKIIGFILNPRLVLCVGIAWLITNGWSYVLFAVGTYFSIEWMIAVSGAYMTFLWFPFTPEKILTAIIAITLLRILFPRDQKTLAILTDLYNKAKEKHKSKKKKDKK